MRSRTGWKAAGIACAALLAAGAAGAADYNPAFCQQVEGTLNVHWQAIAGPFAPCTSLETTDGTLAEARTGDVTMFGVTVSDFTCSFPTAYHLRLQSDGTTLIANTQALYADAPVVGMVLTRGPGEQCFVGRWAFGADVYVAHIWAPPFHFPTVPATEGWALAALAAVLGALGMRALRSHRRRRFSARA